MQPFRLILSLATLAFVTGVAHAAPSFDCKRATSIAETEICGLPELAALDSDVAALYAQAMASLGKDDGRALRDEQKAWLTARNDCGDLVHGEHPTVYAEVNGCLREQMRARKSRLREILQRKQFFGP
jgi:uncharacterized protein YecT (DUF1311 family)